MVEKTLEVPGKEAEASVFQVCRFGELITLSDTKGLYVLEPSATKIWNILRSYMDAELGGVEEKKFPMLIKRDSTSKGLSQRLLGSQELTHGVRAGQQSAKNAIGFIEAIMLIGREEGVKGYWKGNLPQVIRIVPYSAVQLFAYEAYKAIILFWGEDGQLTVLGAGACAGMTSTLITYPLDVLRLRLAVEPGYRTMSQSCTIAVASSHSPNSNRGILILYLLDDDDDSPLQGFLEEREPNPDTKTRVGSNSSETNTGWLPDVVKDFVFPTGFPGSVSDDYLDYMLCLANVTGWMCNVLVTSSLLKAVGVGAFSGSSSGALGRLLIDGKTNQCSCAGSFFDLATQTQFLLSASSCKSFIHTSINQEFTSDNH
ncbi:hypothetical protein F2Q68_00000715 [Brassica cretica]|uniref:Protein root UVB sensitive/RUS domain-containing protein n=1 Tax=Brassica cretica TaxID=69181 RepID=A0A8S9JM73_BRACR|nr:hypothetical protein F2Q68_00000715 [Brassica cretica]